MMGLECLLWHKPIVIAIMRNLNPILSQMSFVRSAKWVGKLVRHCWSIYDAFTRALRCELIRFVYHHSIKIVDLLLSEHVWIIGDIVKNIARGENYGQTYIYTIDISNHSIIEHVKNIHPQGIMDYIEYGHTHRVLLTCCEGSFPMSIHNFCWSDNRDNNYANAEQLFNKERRSASQNYYNSRRFNIIKIR